MKTLSEQAAIIFGYLPAVEFIAAKKTESGYGFSYTAGKPDEINDFIMKMKSHGAVNRNKLWVIPAKPEQSLEDAVAASRSKYFDDDAIENAERYGMTVEEYKAL